MTATADLCIPSHPVRKITESLCHSIRYFLISSVILIKACASTGIYQPTTDTVPNVSNQQTKTLEDVTVSVAILSDAEAQDFFDIDLGAHELQALWLRVNNASPHHLWFIRNQLDRDVYSADEIAEMMRDQVPDKQFEIFRQHLRDRSMRVSIDRNSIIEGFIFLPKHEGGRYVDVRLTRDIYEATTALSVAQQNTIHLNEYRFGFAIPLPDGDFDYERLNTETIYSNRSLPDLDNDAFRKAIEALPCCAQNSDADDFGDPLNIVIVAKSTDLLNSLTRSGWSFTHRISLQSVMRLVGATLQGESYPVAPVSSLYVFNRKQDFALQRARRNIAQRNHMRFWLAPFTYQGQQVWVGQVSRDIGIKLTTKSPTFTTHIIDPQVDVTREYLLHSLLAEGFVAKFGFASGAIEASREDPAYNLTDDPYFSDGKRLVVVLSPNPIPYHEIRSLQWERSAAPIAEGQSQ